MFFERKTSLEASENDFEQSQKSDSPTVRAQAVKRDGD
jgi:hypothetical protein